MGCHQWFYKKINRSYEEARDLYVKAQNESIIRWTEIVDNPLDDSRLAYEWTQELCDRTLAIMKRQLRMVEKGLCREAIFNHQPNESYIYFNKVLYLTDDSLPHDIFRVGNYPEDKLLSFIETLEYAEKRKIKLDNNQKIRLANFWKKHPDGMITFG